MDGGKRGKGGKECEELERKGKDRGVDGRKRKERQGRKRERKGREGGRDWEGKGEKGRRGKERRGKVMEILVFLQSYPLELQGCC